MSVRAVLLGFVLLAAPPTVPAPQEAAPAADATRARLETLSPEERLRLARNLEQFERLPQRTRAKLLERARVLRERERTFGHALAGEPVARQEGDQALHEAGKRWRAFLRERGREVRERLPERVLRRLEQAPPEVRRTCFERLIEQQERLGPRVLERACERAELSPSEARQLEHLPRREQMRALRAHYAGRAAR